MNRQGSSSFAIKGIHHYTLCVADMAQSIEWYRRKLGFEQTGDMLINGNNKIAYLQNQGILLKLIQPSKPLPLPHYRSLPNTDNAVQGNKHFSLLVKDGVMAGQHLAALGVPVVFVAIVDDTYGNFICDPTGNLIEVLQEELPKSSPGLYRVSDNTPVVIEGWSHAAISVPDAEQSMVWYIDHLGFTFKHTHQSSAPGRPRFKITWLQAPNFCLEIFEVAGSATLPSDRLHLESDFMTLGNKYFSLAVTDLKEARRGLESLGVDIIPGITGADSLFIRDDIGILVELMQSNPLGSMP